MFEKPMGLWAILEEESLFPKATDKSFEEKLKASLGKLPIFLKPQSKTDKNAHFALSHYAGIVSYNVTGWLEKNKDPVNDTVVEIFKSTSSCALLVHLWADHPGQPTTAPKDEGKKKKKGGGGKTVSSVYLVSLGELMNTLHTCDPHFVRCLVPNTHKKPGEVEPPLIMHQLTCNGVLEGIRICMRGFPNRMLYPDFKMRYSCLGSEELRSSEDNKTAVYALMDKIGFDRARYRLGHTLVFFRAGALAGLEENRDDIVLDLVRKFQGEVRRKIRGNVYAKRRDQRELIKVCQRQLRQYMQLRSWGWFVVIQKTRPLIGQPNPQEELRQLEEKCKEVYGAYEEAVNVTKQLEEDNVKIKEDTIALKEELSKKSGDLAVYEQKQAEAMARKAKAEDDLLAMQQNMARAEAERIELQNQKKSMEGGIGGKKKEVEEVRMQLQKVENEKNSKEHTMKGLNEEIAEQDEIINRLNKEKKMVGEQSAKSSEDLLAAEDKVNHLLNIKKKLECTLDELEGSYDKEKRNRTQAEKDRRKLEGELKMMQDTVADFERSKKDLEAMISRKEKDIATLSSKLEDEQGGVIRIQKTIKEYQQRIEELEEELEAERQSRANAERQRSDLARELEDLGERLDEAGGATAAQIELNKKREAELLKLRKDLEEANIQHEAVVNGLKKKHGDAVQEMNEQIDALQKMKSKIEKDKAHIQNEIADARAALEEIQRSKAAIEKANKSLQNKMNEQMKKVEEAKYALSDIENIKRKTASENADFLRCVGELDNSLSILLKTKNDLAAQLNEARDRQLLVGKYKNCEHEFDGAREVLDEETSALDNLARTVTKAEGEAQQWRQKYEVEAVAKAEELEMGRMKLQARLSESEMTITNLQLKLSQIEKTKAKTQSELEEMIANLDQAQIMQHTMEKRAKQFDKVCGEWKGKVDGLSKDLDNSQKETRIASAELFRVKSAYDESILQLDEVRRENKTLSNEIKDIMDQISEGGRSIHEIDKIRKRLE